MILQTVDDAFQLLQRLGASPLLILHHRLVAEAAEELLKGWPQKFNIDIDWRKVLLGSALHDAGKVIHPEEISGPGKTHGKAGRDWLIQNGVDPSIACFCDTHIDWNRTGLKMEDFIVMLADNLWKGQRCTELEELTIKCVAKLVSADYWEVFMKLDTLFETIAAHGDERLARSR